MTQPNDSIAVTPGLGATVATHLPAGMSAECEAAVEVDESGHIQGSKPTYIYTTPAIAVGASKLLADLFNATGSGKVMRVLDYRAFPKLDAAVTGAVAVRVDLYRTSAIGTGGTAASADSATIDVGGGNFVKLDESNSALPAGITARVAPAGGATISRWLYPVYLNPEESAGSSGYMHQNYNLIPKYPWAQRLVVRENTGLLFKQGAVASVGSVIIRVVFTLE